MVRSARDANASRQSRSKCFQMSGTPFVGALTQIRRHRPTRGPLLLILTLGCFVCKKGHAQSRHIDRLALDHNANRFLVEYVAMLDAVSAVAGRDFDRLSI